MLKKEGSIFKFAFGFVSGFVLGLLFAPKSGRELRGDLLNKSKEFKKITMDKLEEIQQISKSNTFRIPANIQVRANKISSKLDELARRGTDILIQDEVQ